MNNQIKESDWKKMRKIKDELLNKACDDILADLEGLIAERTGREHKTYQELWKRLKQRDQAIASMFDDLRRSTAVIKLTNWVDYGLISLEDIEDFSEETKDKVKSLLEIRYR